MLKKIIEIILLVIIVNVLSSYIHVGIDLSEDKTHSLSNKSKEIIKNIDDKLYIKVYLEGDFPADFKHLRQATYNMLKRFNKTNNLLDFEFINPNTSNSEENKQVFNQLIKLGLAPTDLQVRNSNSTSSQIIFPGAILFILILFLNLCDKDLAKVFIDDFATEYELGAPKYSTPAIEEIKIKAPDGLIFGKNTFAEFNADLKLISQDLSQSFSLCKGFKDPFPSPTFAITISIFFKFLKIKSEIFISDFLSVASPS